MNRNKKLHQNSSNAEIGLCNSEQMLYRNTFEFQSALCFESNGFIVRKSYDIMI